MNTSRRIAEWDWVVTEAWDELHAPEAWDDPHEDMTVLDGRTACGMTGMLSVPGPLTRLGAIRCAPCCEATGMPPGKGSPKNNDQCHPIVEQRIATVAGS